MDFGTILQWLEDLDIDRLKEIGDYATSSVYTDDERAPIAYADAKTRRTPRSPTSRWPTWSGGPGAQGWSS